MELFRNPNFDFLGKSGICVAASVILILAGVGAMLTKGIPMGIDFRGGADVQVKFKEAPAIDDLRAALGDAGFGTVTIQRFGAAEDNEVLIRLDPRTSEEEEAEQREQEDIARDILDALRAGLGAGDQQGKLDLNTAGSPELESALTDLLGAGRIDEVKEVAAAIIRLRNASDGILGSVEQVKGLPEVSTEIAGWLDSSATTGPFTVLEVYYVGPAVGSELRSKAMWAVLFSLSAMLIYIAFRFHAPAYGVAAIITLTHDVLVVLGFIAFFQKEFDLSVLAAVLTIVGYSVNDTIVIFDRVRDNLRLQRREEMQSIFNTSINQCLSRTILTSVLVFMVLASIWVFGGARLEPFSFALLIGTVSGTYSTIYIAAPVVILWTRVAQRGQARAA